MVIDAANGVEAQTRRLIEVCRQRDTPIITFVNKMDREVRDPLDILDEVERELGMPCVPMTWPVGQGKTFGGIINLRTQAMTVFESGSERRPQDFETIPLTDPTGCVPRFGQDFDDAWRAWSWPWAPRPPWTTSLPGRQADAGVLRLGREQLRCDGSAGRAGGHGAPARPAHQHAGGQQAAGGKDHPARGRGLLRRGVQGAGQHGRQPPRPHRLCARGLGQIHPGHEAQGAAHRQRAAPHQRGHLHEPAPRGGGRSLRGRHHRLHHARRRAAGRHHHRRRQPAVHRPALLRARAVHDRDAEEPAAHQAAAAGPGAAGRGRRDPGLQARRGRPHAAGRRGPAAV
jgi:hypothetical protein